MPRSVFRSGEPHPLVSQKVKSGVLPIQGVGFVYEAAKVTVHSMTHLLKQTVLKTFLYFPR